VDENLVVLRRPASFLALAFAAVAVGLLHARPALSSPAEPAKSLDPYARVRGVMVSCPRAGLEWGTDDMVHTLGILHDLGVNWVSIHPYGGLADDGTVGHSRIDRLYDDPSWLQRAIREAHAKGLKIAITPHLAYWRTRFSYRSEICFDDDASWRRFFETYQEFIVKVADLSEDADALVVGSELDGTIQHDAEWRKVIAAVRGTFHGPITYASGWDAYTRVKFWDALDVVCVDGYFPLVDHDGMPTDAELQRGWARVASELDAFGKRTGRHVVLGELGYNRSMQAAVRPWDYREDDDPRAEQLQTRCLDTALHAIAKSDTVVGAFLWKWLPGEDPDDNFLASTPAMQKVIEKNWGPTHR
jgi:hypothetical protein